MKTNKNVRFPADSSIWRCAGPCQLWGEHPDVAAPGPSGSSGEVQKQSRGRQQLEGRGPHIGGGPRQALHPLPKGGLGLGSCLGSSTLGLSGCFSNPTQTPPSSVPNLRNHWDQFPPPPARPLAVWVCPGRLCGIYPRHCLQIQPGLSRPCRARALSSGFSAPAALRSDAPFRPLSLIPGHGAKAARLPPAGS